MIKLIDIIQECYPTNLCNPQIQKQLIFLFVNFLLDLKIHSSFKSFEEIYWNVYK